MRKHMRFTQVWTSLYTKISGTNFINIEWQIRALQMSIAYFI